jgi:hypothetical protein
MPYITWKNTKRGKKIKAFAICTQNKKERLIIIIVLIFITGHIVAAGIYNYILTLLIPYSLFSQQTSQPVVILYLGR